MSSKNRGRLLVDRRVQLSLVRRVVIHWISFVALFLLIVLTLEMFLREPGVSALDSFAVSLKKNALLFTLMLAIMPAFLYDTVKMSNRFAGPVSRLKNGLSALANGEQVEEMNFRKGDFWGELAEDFNRVVQRISSDSRSSESVKDTDANNQTSDSDSQAQN